MCTCVYICRQNLTAMEKGEAETNDETMQCLNNCGKEIKNMEDHIKDCPLQIVECGWCGLIQPRNVFKEHIILANPETEVNNSQQCMQQQYDQLFKQQEQFKKYSKEQDDALKRFSDDIQNINNFMQRFSNDIKVLNENNKRIYIYIYACIFVIFMLVGIVAYHHYCLSSQKMPSYKTTSDQMDDVLLSDSFSNKELVTKQQMLKEMEKSQAELANFRAEIDDKINQLNISMIADAKQWQKHFKEMEKNFTTIADLKLEIDGQLNEFNKSMLNDVKQWQRHLEKDFTTIAKLADHRLEVNGQINKFNKSMNDNAKKWQEGLKEMEKGCTTTAELADLKTEVNGRISTLNKSMQNDAKQWQKHFKEMEKNFTTIADLKLEIDGQLNEFNKSMLNDVKQWQTFGKRFHYNSQISRS